MDIEFRAADGTPLAGTLYESPGSDVVLIASALGVKRRYYHAFATHLAAHGRSVITFDYRGIGGSRPQSLRGFAADMSDWGRLDLAAAIAWATRVLRPSSLALVGHSAGGQLAGLAPNATSLSRIILVAAQSGYWGHWSGVRKWGLGALWLAMPAISRAIGFFPARLAGLGSEDLPRGVASRWAYWGRHRDYLFREHDPEQYARLRVPLMAWSFEGDHYAPRAAVDALVARYSGAIVTRRHLDRLGHFEVFRRGEGEPVWDEMLAWLSA
ncbi:MAG TPA: alpha/beta fold hydrolase [Thermoanaerobaculia bacterium]|jgi:predicted alpha/beta hydrolase